jgi:hypothetical protein
MKGTRRRAKGRATRKAKRKGPFSESQIKNNLTLAHYNKWLKGSFYWGKPKDDDWDPATGSCGAHASFVIEQLGFKVKDFGNYTLTTTSTIKDIFAALDKGYLVDLIHNYADRDMFSKLPKDNRYGNHQFQIIKGGDKYFVTQGFLHAYKHSLRGYSREEIQTMLQDILTKLSDYENTKRWGDLELDLYKKYFRTELFLYPQRRVPLDRRVHNVVLKYDVYTMV